MGFIPEHRKTSKTHQTNKTRTTQKHRLKETSAKQQKRTCAIAAELCSMGHVQVVFARQHTRRAKGLLKSGPHAVTKKIRKGQISAKMLSKTVEMYSMCVLIQISREALECNASLGADSLLLTPWNACSCNLQKSQMMAMFALFARAFLQSRHAAPGDALFRCVRHHTSHRLHSSWHDSTWYHHASPRPKVEHGLSQILALLAPPQDRSRAVA